MRRYETIVIIDPDLPEDDRTAVLTRIQEIIPQQEGVFLQEDLWGVKKLAYDIKKKPRGYYARIDYCGIGKAVDELERFFRIDDRVMKYLTVQLEEEADVEKIKAEIEAAAQAKAAQAQEASAEHQAAAEASVATQEEAAPEEPKPVEETAKADETTPES